MCKVTNERVVTLLFFKLLVRLVASFLTMPVVATDVDRLFLQAVLSRGLLSATLAKSLWEKAIDAVNGTKLNQNVTLSLLNYQRQTMLSKFQIPRTKTHGILL